MADNQDGVIRESDLIQADGTIDSIIGKIDEMNTALGSLSTSVRQTASSLNTTLSKASGATEAGRKSIEKFSADADQLSKVSAELKNAMSELSKQTEILKEKASSSSKVTASQKQVLDTTVKAYSRMSYEIKELVSLYNSLSVSEKNESGYGVAIIRELQEKTKALKQVLATISPVITEMSALAKAEKELAYWQSEEGRILIDLKERTKEVKKVQAESAQQKAALEKAQRKLNYSRSEEAAKLQELNIQTKEELTLKKLEAAVSQAAEGSFNSLVAQYNLARFKLKGMSQGTEESNAAFEDQVALVRQLRAQIQIFNENLGDYSMNVGHYENAFYGLNFQVQQVVRELPAAAVSLNTFFLAISNNIPMLVDEIKKFRAAGNSMKVVVKNIAKSLLSWQTALVVALAVFSKFGKQIIDFVSQVVFAESATRRLSRVTKELNEELKSSNDSYGEHMLKVRQLTDAYKNLNSEQEKADWIKQHENDWRELNVQVSDALDFEKKFIDGTNEMQKAFKQRAMAAAAQKLMEEKYNKVLEKQVKLENTQEYSTVAMTSPTVGASVGTYTKVNPVYAATKKEIENTLADIEILYTKYTENLVGSNEFFGTSLDGTIENLDTFLNNLNLKLLKKYETAVTKLQTSEIEKRRAEVTKEYETESLELKNIIATLGKKLNDSTKNLTEAQKEQIRTLLYDAKEALALFEDAYNKQMDEIAVDAKITAIQILDKANSLRLAYVKEGSEAEKNARLTALDNQMKIELLENSKLIEEERQNEKEIRKKYDKQREDIEKEWSIKLLEIQEEGLSLKIESLTKGSKEELNKRIELLDLQQKIELEKNKNLAKEERQAEEDIIAKYDKMRIDANNEYYKNLYDTKANNIQKSIELTQKGSEKEYNLTIEMLDRQYEAAVLANSMLAKELQLDVKVIKEYYDKLKQYASGNYTISRANVESTNKEINLVRTNNITAYGQEGSRKRDLYNTQRDMRTIELQYAEFLKGNIQLSTEQVAQLVLQYEQLQKQEESLKGINGLISDIADGGIAGGILGALGFNDEAVDAFSEAINTVKDCLSDLYDAEVELAEKEAELAEERVANAQSALDAELEARANGYANNVSQARKELELEKQKQKQKQAILAEAQRKQERIDSLTQASSLITASAEIWKTFSSGGPVGMALAAAAIATMLGSFIATKAKAKQLTQQEYGEGGLEILEGGSHASGNDIDLHTKNSKGKNMRAEGGEALAIINKRNTKKYRGILPDVINSLNDGTFQDKFLNAFDTSSLGGLVLSTGPQVDLSSIESEVKGIRRQNESKTILLSDGSILIQERNVRRIIHKS